MKAENLNFSEDGVKEIYQRVISLLWNTFSFYKLYGSTAKVSPTVPKSTHVLDIWIISRTNRLIKEITESMDGYDMVTSCRLVVNFIDDLSTWYLRRSRERFKVDPVSMAVFGWVVSSLVKVMAPLTPFISELVWQNMSAGESVHLQVWPTTDTSVINDSLEQDMNRARQLVAMGHAVRKADSKPVKEQLRRLTLTTDDSYEWMKKKQNVLQVVLDELNVLELEVNGTVLTTDSSAMSDEELANRNRTRALIRQIQGLRKDKKLGIKDMVVLVLPKEYKSLPKAYLDEISKTTLTKEISWGDQLSLSTG
jgi:isoleucyl-tRNA synthetase